MKNLLDVVSNYFLYEGFSFEMQVVFFFYLLKEQEFLEIETL